MKFFITFSHSANCNEKISTIIIIIVVVFVVVRQHNPPTLNGQPLLMTLMTYMKIFNETENIIHVRSWNGWEMLLCIHTYIAMSWGGYGDVYESMSGGRRVSVVITKHIHSFSLFCLLTPFVYERTWICAYFIVIDFAIRCYSKATMSFVFSILKYILFWLFISWLRMVMI